MTTPEQARDEMLAVFKAAWDQTGYTARYPDLPGGPPQTAEPWARASVVHSGGRQTSLSNSAGAKKHTHTGAVIVQIFVPMGDGMGPAYTLARSVLQAYRDARGAVWYRNHRFREAGDDGAYSQINCTIEFSYDDA